jgi:translation initiation factor 2B subunit (eIF-2B alpha/beta/delta family)
MDIETLRKIQETEKALRIHNISVSTQEASDQVSRDVYVGGTKVPSFEDVSQTPGEKVLRAKEEAYQQSQKREVRGMDDKTVTDLKKEVNEQSELIGNQAKLIFELQSVVNEIIREVKKLQSSVPTKNPAERQQVLKAEEKVDHPRSGGYSSSDVSVEKFFNFSGSR